MVCSFGIVKVTATTSLALCFTRAAAWARAMKEKRTMAKERDMRI
jgi:hypothetical protein